MLPSLLPDDCPRYNRHQARHQDFVKGVGVQIKKLCTKLLEISVKCCIQRCMLVHDFNDFHTFADRRRRRKIYEISTIFAHFLLFVCSLGRLVVFSYLQLKNFRFSSHQARALRPCPPPPWRRA